MNVSFLYTYIIIASRCVSTHSIKLNTKCEIATSSVDFNQSNQTHRPNIYEKIVKQLPNQF